MTIEPRPLDKRRAEIQGMFSQVAPRYDLLNRLLSARRDVVWRRTAARALGVEPDGLVLVAEEPGLAEDLLHVVGEEELPGAGHDAFVLARARPAGAVRRHLVPVRDA